MTYYYLPKNNTSVISANSRGLLDAVTRHQYSYPPRRACTSLGSTDWAVRVGTPSCHYGIDAVDKQTQNTTAMMTRKEK